MSLFQQFPTTAKRLGLSFGIEKILINALHEAEDLTDDVFRNIVAGSYSAVYPVEAVEQNLDGLVSRVLSRIEELQEKESTSKQPIKKKTFGSSYSEWLSELDATAVCLYIADYDIDKALNLYWTEDYLLVNEAMKVKSGHESQITLTRMEASMYGTGNRYNDDNGNDPNTVNIDDANPEDIQAFMSGFGF